MSVVAISNKSVFQRLQSKTSKRGSLCFFFSLSLTLKYPFLVYGRKRKPILVSALVEIKAQYKSRAEYPDLSVCPFVCDVCLFVMSVCVSDLFPFVCEKEGLDLIADLSVHVLGNITGNLWAAKAKKWLFKDNHVVVFISLINKSYLSLQIITHNM